MCAACRKLMLMIAFMGWLVSHSALAAPPAEPDLTGVGTDRLALKNARAFSKSINQPNPFDYRKLAQRRRILQALEQRLKQGLPADKAMEKNLVGLSKTGQDKVLVLLVEFAGTDKFLWTPNVSTWDPIGKSDGNENTGDWGTVAATQNIIKMYNLNSPTTFTYSGPLHNQIARPLSEADRSGTSIWAPDFSPQYYQDIIFGNGYRFQYKRQDGSTVDVDFTGKSVNNYYRDLSAGQYSINGTVVGWLQLPHSVWWYGADPAPGARSGGAQSSHDGGIPGAGSLKSLVIDALQAVKKSNPNFDWKSYDANHDGVIDRLWIIHAGLGEEDSPTLLNRTLYGEANVWSHSSGLAPNFAVYADGQTTISAGPYIMMPENCGISVLAHEFGHNLGADDLYSYGGGDTSAGFWTVMADNWTGFPFGFEPPAVDPWHLDGWGWLNPKLIADPAAVYRFTVGQASAFPGGSGVYRGAKILLEDQVTTRPVLPNGHYYWMGGKEDQANGMLTLKQPIAIPATGQTTLSLNLAYDIEERWDFLWVQASTNGTSWTTLANKNTMSMHDSGWIGGLYGFPNDLAAAGIGGFTGTSAGYPALVKNSFSLTAFAGKSVYLRFWYMTDWGTLGGGPYFDDITVVNGGTTLFSDNGEKDSGAWNYAAPLIRTDKFMFFTHNYYLQWRNTGANGGYDEALGDMRWRYGPANSGLLVWYNNNKYTDNEILNNLFDSPSFGPKGRMLVVDAHPDPYRDPYWVNAGYPNETSNVPHRSLMRDAPFSLNKCVDFMMGADSVTTYSANTYVFTGDPAVSRFSDANGYFPGIEYASRGPGYIPPSYKWITRQFDAGTVVPSKVPYSIKGPGYTGNLEFRYQGSRYPGGRISCYWLPNGLGYDGGAGNPSDYTGQYGWNVKILAQSATTATLVVWNPLHGTPLKALNDTYSYIYKAGQTQLSVAAPGFLGNDAGPAGWQGAMRLQIDKNCAHGTLALVGNGGFSYQAQPAFRGKDSFVYRIVSDFDQVSTGTVTIEVQSSARDWQNYR